MVSKDLGSLLRGTRGQVLENLSTMVNMVVYLTELGKSVMVNSNMGPWSLWNKERLQETCGCLKRDLVFNTVRDL